MKLTAIKPSVQGAPTAAVLEHNGETLEWNIAFLDKMSYSGMFDLFEQINGYWAHLAKPVQDKIFDIYRQMREIFNSVWETHDLTAQLYHLVAEFYKYHELADIKFWIEYRSDPPIIWPAGLPESFKDLHESSGGTREKTYLKADYQWLVALSVALRPMIPIWGEFIARTKKEHGSTFKEYYAFKLLSYASIAKSEPMERLRVYVEHSLPPDRSKSTAIISAISSEDYPIWMLSLVTVRRLSVADVRGIDPRPNANVVAELYKYIGMKTKGHDSSFIGMVKDKVVDGQGQDGENNLSKLEGYKIKQEIPAGDIVMLEHYMSDPFAVAARICCDIPPQLVQESLISTEELEQYQLSKAQIVLAQMVLKTGDVLPPRGLLHLSKPLVVKAIATSQALLWYRGYYDLAALISAIEQGNEEELQLSGPDSWARIPKETMEALDAFFPHPRKLPGKSKVIKRSNPAAEAIESIRTMLAANDWRLTLPDNWVAHLTGNKNNRRYAAPHDLRIKLANLALALAKRSF